MLATCEVRGRPAGETHGSLLLIDLTDRSVAQKFEFSAGDADPRTRDDNLGLRGVAGDDQHIYVAASDRLLKLTRDFTLVDSWHCVYLMGGGELQVHKQHAFVVSMDYDSILGFHLQRQVFDWALHVDLRGQSFRGRLYDPQGNDGPLRLGKLGLNDLHASGHGMYVSGERTGGMLHFNGRALRMAAELPNASRNARPFRDGVLFNALDSGHLRYAGRGDAREDRAMRVGGELTCGLCPLSESLVAVGTSPAAVVIFDLAGNEEVLRVSLSEDPNTTIRSISCLPSPS